MNRLFLLLFKNKDDRTSHSGHYLPKVEIKDYNAMSNSFFDQAISNDFKTYENLRKFITGQGDEYAAGCLLDYPYSKDNYKMIAINLSKQKALYSDPNAIQQISFTSHLVRAGDIAMFFIIEWAKENVIDFSQGTAKVL